MVIFWWTLKDNHGESIEFWEKLGVEPYPLMSERPDNRWVPSTYEQPLPKIMDEAVTNLTDALREHVFPTLLR